MNTSSDKFGRATNSVSNARAEPRRWTQNPLPAYAYTPGKSPHPVRDPQGHSYGQESEPQRFDPGAWDRCEAFLFGIDLFNFGYYWEAHESWEAIWKPLDRRSPLACLLQGLIKLAAAGVKAREGRAEGVRRHAERSEQLLAFANQNLPRDAAGVCLGLRLESLVAHARQLAENSRTVVDASDRPVVRVMPFTLELNG